MNKENFLMYSLEILISIFLLGIALGISIVCLIAGKLHIFPKYGEIKFPYQEWMQIKRWK